MISILPPHEAQDEAKLASLIESFRIGKSIPAIVAYEDKAICGSHRIHALNQALKLWNSCTDGWEETEEPSLDVIELSDDDFKSASEHGGFDSLFDHFDYNDVCKWVFEVSKDKGIIAALEDQI